MATIKNYSTFVIQTGEQLNSITLDALQQQMAPLARQAGVGYGGRAGLMFPDDTLLYDPSTGKLSVKSNYIREYVGLVGYDSVDGQTPNMNGSESAGNFYVVADFKYKYTQNDWATASSSRDQLNRVYVGDILEKKGDGTGTWDIIPMQIGKQTIHSDFTNYLHIDYAQDPTVLGDTSATSDSYIIQAEGY